MTRLLIFAAGIILGVLAAMKLTWSREPKGSPNVADSWREDDDGIQPIDPYSLRVFGLPLGELERAVATADMLDPLWRRP